MRTLIAGTIGMVVLSVSSGRAQEKRDPDGDPDMLEALAKVMKDGRSINQIRQDNALIRAAAGGDLDGMRKALKAGARIDARYIDGWARLDLGLTGYTALMRAVWRDQAAAVNLLIEQKAATEVRHPVGGYTALSLAVARGRPEIIDLLVKAGAKGDPAKMRLTRDLIRAACQGFDGWAGYPYPTPPGEAGDSEVGPDIAEAVRSGADVNLTDPNGHTALMYAASLGLVDNVRALLDRGADPTRKAANGDTALSIAERDDAIRAEERRAVAEVLKEHLAKSKK